MSADDQRREDQRRPIADAEIGEQHPGHEGAHHVLRAMGEIDDVEKAEDDGQPKAQHGVKRAVDQPEQELAVKARRRDAEHCRHEDAPDHLRCARHLPQVGYLTSGQLPSVERAEGLLGRDGGAAACNSPTAPSTPRASSPRRDTWRGYGGRRRGPRPCRTADPPMGISFILAMTASASLAFRPPSPP